MLRMTRAFPKVSRHMNETGQEQERGLMILRISAQLNKLEVAIDDIFNTVCSLCAGQSLVAHLGANSSALC